MRWEFRNQENYEKHLARGREYKRKNREKMRNQLNEWTRENPHKVASYKMRPGDAIPEPPTRPRADACEECQRPGITVYDHDHTTGKFRNWLCPQCNRAKP